ncbi:MAG: hypothetical protein E7647_04615 [Ruminococcaceae bacterium]|nr:hypothetical protein [Oscillospiraceae bacterium]
MKKVLSLILALVMIVPCLLVGTSASEGIPSYSLGSRIELARYGDDAVHGNHQTRTVHTSHGDYAAYVTGTYTDGKGQTVNKWSLIKIDTAKGTSSVVFTGEKYYDSSQVSLLVDKDENVWAITSTSDSGRNLTGEGIDARAHRLDAVTGEITSYTSIISGGAQDGYGYATCFYDEKYNRIIVMHAGGDYVEGLKRASFNWTIFDLRTNRWQTRVRHVMIDSRHCYMFGYADGKGGLILVAQRDIKAASLGYPEIGSDKGLTSSDYQYMSQNGINRWSANYCWDQLDLFYFPKITESKHTQYSVCEADYSKVTGTQEERYTLSYRLRNYYSAVQNNNGGDVLLTTEADGKMLLHITYNKALIQAAMDRSIGCESKWYHQVWDVTDGADGAVKLYEGVLVDEMAGESGFGFRLYEDSKGNVNIIRSHNGTLTVLRTEYDGKGGYSYSRVGETKALSGAGSILNISSHRSGSPNDDHMNILYSSGGRYVFCQATLFPVAYEPVECGHVWVYSESESRAPICTAEGYDVYRCSYCNDSKSVTTAALGHCLVLSEEVQPTCTEDGYVKYICTRCQRTSTEALPATGHSMVPLSASPATCTEDGFEKWICENGCNLIETTTIPSPGHSYAGGSCTECGKTDPDQIPELSVGDLNGDGELNAMDVNIVKRLLAGVVSPSDEQLKAADVNGDGSFTSLDSNALSRIVSGL